MAGLTGRTGRSWHRPGRPRHTVLSTAEDDHLCCSTGLVRPVTPPPHRTCPPRSGAAPRTGPPHATTVSLVDKAHLRPRTPGAPARPRRGDGHPRAGRPERPPQGARGSRGGRPVDAGRHRDPDVVVRAFNQFEDVRGPARIARKEQLCHHGRAPLRTAAKRPAALEARQGSQDGDVRSVRPLRPMRETAGTAWRLMRRGRPP